MSTTLIYLLIGGAALYYLFFMGGKEQLAGMLGDLGGSLGLGGGTGGGDAGGSSGGGGGADIIGSSQTSSGSNSWTDSKGNNFNIDNDVRSASNVSGGASAAGIQSQVEAMLKKAGVSGSRQNVSMTRQVDTTGQAKQTQTRSQRSNYATVRLSI